MTKVVLNDVGYAPTSAATINNNNTLIEQAVENTLSRDGTGPNEMNSNLDMNNNRVINLPEPVGDTEPARKGDLDDLLAAASSGIIATKVEAEVGSDNKKVMSPFRTAQAVQANVFPTRAELLARNLPAVQTRVRTSGYTTPGIGAADYVETPDAPLPGGFTSPGGRKWNLVENNVYVEMFGYIGLSSSDADANSDVTGTTGADGNVTIGIIAGNIRIENRIGGASMFRFTFVG